MRINWTSIQARLVAAGKWVVGLLALIAMYFFATRASRQANKARRAHEKYVEAATDEIDDRWREAEKHVGNHNAAQSKARAAKDNARKVRDAVTSEDSTLDDLFAEYQSRRGVPDEPPHFT